VNRDFGSGVTISANGRDIGRRSAAYAHQRYLRQLDSWILWTQGNHKTVAEPQRPRTGCFPSKLRSSAVTWSCPRYHCCRSLSESPALVSFEERRLGQYTLMQGRVMECHPENPITREVTGLSVGVRETIGKRMITMGSTAVSHPGAALSFSHFLYPASF